MIQPFLAALHKQHLDQRLNSVPELVVVYLTQLIPAQETDDYNKLRSGIYQAIID